MAKAKKKKRNKRTPQQLEKMRQKQREAMERNTLKHKKNMEEILKVKLTNNTYDPNEEYFYHLTTPKKYEKILNSKGIKAVNVKKSWEHMSKDGWVYATDSNDENVWNGISTNMICDNEMEVAFYQREGKKYIVIGIKKSAVEKYKIVEDYCGEILSDTFVRIGINTNVIPHKDMVLVGEFITNQKEYLEDYRMIHLNNKLKGKENIKVAILA